jgi:hypothetical protein
MGCCCSAASWKEEEVQDYKFSYIDVNEFVLSNCYYRLKYCFLFLLVMKDILIYMADIFTVVQYLAFGAFDSNPGLDDLRARWSWIVEALKWAYLGSIFISLVLLLFEIRKGRKITQSGYISTAFTNTIAYRQYAIASFAHFSLFERIEMYKKPIDRVAFFVFFSLKGKSFLIICHCRSHCL